MSINILYPAAIDNNTSLPNVIDNVTSINAEVINRLKVAIIAVETELGVKPSGIYLTVRNRLDVLEGLINGTVFAGDLISIGTGQEVIGFYGRPLSNTPPTLGQSYAWNGSQWAPTTVNNFTPAGDLSGNAATQTVTGIQNIPVSPTTPVINQVLQYNGSQYIPVTISTVLSGDVTGSQNSTTVGQRKFFLLMGA